MSGRTESTLVRRAKVALVSLAAFTLVACAGSSRNAETIGTAAGPEAIAKLHAAAEAQSRRPLKFDHVEFPPGVPPDQLAAIPDDPSHPGRLSLDDALAAISLAQPKLDVEPATEVDHDSEAEALRLYLAGRTKLLTGDASGAQTDLIASLRLDPRPGEVWRELGEAQFALGNRSGAFVAMQRAQRRQPDDLRVLERLGRLALDRRDYLTSAHALGRLYRLNLAETDPALPYIVGSQLGRSLISLGYVKAALDPLVASTDLPDRFTQTTTRQDELALVYRQRGDVWRDIGDAHARLGEFANALAAYDMAIRSPSLNPSSILPRRVYTALRLGLPALADALIVDQIIAAHGRADDRVLELIAYSAGRASNGAPELARAIEAIPTVLPADDAAACRPWILRARAAALGPEGALIALREEVLRSPSDQASLRDLMSRRATEGAVGVVDEAVRLTHQRPLHEARYSRAMIRTGIPISELITAIDALPEADHETLAAALLRARLAGAQGGLDEASSILADTYERFPHEPAAIVAYVRMLTARGEYERGGELLDQIPDDSSPALRYAKAMALADRDEDEHAVALLEPLLTDDQTLQMGQLERAEIAVLAARLYQRLERASDAERLFKTAIAGDPLRDDAYAGLMQLYSTGGPLADDDKFIAIARQLATTNPSSPTLRFLHAREARNAGRLDQAQRELIELDSEYPARAEVLDLLMVLWIRNAALRDAEQWLRSRLHDEPAMGEYAVRLSDVILADNRPEEAATVLRDRLKIAPDDAAASRRLEGILRDPLGDIDAADTLALERLDRTPRTIDALLERAAIQWRRGELSQARSAVKEALSRPGIDSESRLPQLSTFVSKVGIEADRSSQDVSEAVELLSEIIDRFPGVSVQAHATRIVLLASHLDDQDALLRAVVLASQSHESLRDGAFLLAIDELLNRAENKLDPQDPRLLAIQSRAMAIAHAGSSDGRVLTVPLAAQWIRVALLVRDVPAMREAIATIRTQLNLNDVLDMFIAREQADESIKKRVHAAMLCQIAEVFLYAGEEEEGNSYYRLALEAEPENPVANNSLGYQMLERGENIDQAAAMIEIAYRRFPQSEAIADSMGWARYKQGVIHDEPDVDGKPGRMGAVTYLGRAYAIAQSNDEPDLIVPVIADHYADALWAAGEHERAIRIWELSVQACERLRAAYDIGPDDKITDSALKNGLSQSALKEILDSGTNARVKINAAKSGGSPTIAPMHEPMNVPVLVGGGASGEVSPPVESVMPIPTPDR